LTAPQSCPLAVENFEDTQLLRWPHLAAAPGFAHAVTTRPWNMAVHRGPQAEQTVARRRRLCEHLGFDFERLTAPNQVHSPHVLRVEPGDVGAGRDGPRTALQFVDGLVCELRGVPLIQFSADCPLIVAVAARRRAFGVAHASWRGIVTCIAVELVGQLQQCFDVAPEDLVVGIAPCAGPTEYEVGDDVRRIALTRLGGAERFFARRGDRWTFDMRAANAAQLLDAGVRPENIVAATESTLSDPRFFSHRRDGPDTGRFALFAGFPE